MPRKFRAISGDTLNTRLLYADQLGTEPTKYVYEIEADEVGDEYHTMHELYTHRMALTIALTKIIDDTSDVHDLEAYRSKKHHPESNQMFEGYFIVWVSKDDKVVMSYHYDLKHWDKFSHLMELKWAPKYDGHTPKDVVERLMNI